MKNDKSNQNYFQNKATNLSSKFLDSDKRATFSETNISGVVVTEAPKKTTKHILQ